VTGALSSSEFAVFLGLGGVAADWPSFRSALDAGDGGPWSGVEFHALIMLSQMVGAWTKRNQTSPRREEIEKLGASRERRLPTGAQVFNLPHKGGEGI